jgi:sporulation protein YlmC with PRC-barrel domain
MAGKNPRFLTTACELESMTVHTSDGKRLGRVFDLRCKTRDGEPPEVDAIVYGRRGLLERLGLRKALPTLVHWDKVRSIENRVIVVASAPPNKDKQR